MVTIQRLIREPKAPEPDTSMFNNIEVYVQSPTDKPNPAWLVQARAYEFEGTLAMKFATTSPHCGEGIFFERKDITEQYGYKFIGCPKTKIGMAVEIPPFDDPFQNPIKNGKIAESELDTDLISASGQDVVDSDVSLADKLKFDV